ncbi:helix-hairpin-helix domain-containing protein [Halococcus salifodinae]|uniref:Poly(R)-hydroxyalkanoic acid synthase subunit PhaC n=1 Tax=Halococcus salifodinae DSM 8989 TaxID=1227456 RepID=M0MTI5_9EURY|nr:helix-hairpin-helix domain-containing protein [Halococcus salifodinae]EMA47790.1 poly(R)-hydroxyalkanoic acid synthase subunit PhaC [Halococcus salifodinae DSM 8989]
MPNNQPRTTTEQSDDHDEDEGVPVGDRPPFAMCARDSNGEQSPDLTSLDGVGPALAHRLPDEGYETIADLADATREDLLTIDEIGERRARLIIAEVNNHKVGEQR